MIHEVSIFEVMLHDLVKSIVESRIHRDLTKDEYEMLWTEVLSRKNRTKFNK